MILNSYSMNSFNDTAYRLIFYFLEGVNSDGFSLLKYCLATLKYLYINELLSLSLPTISIADVFSCISKISLIDFIIVKWVCLFDPYSKNTSSNYLNISL